MRAAEAIFSGTWWSGNPLYGSFPQEKTIHFAPEKLKNRPDLVGQSENGPALADIVHVCDVSAMRCEVYNDVASEHLLITL